MSRWIRRAVRAALAAEGVRARTETSVAVLGDRAMRTLNRTYRAKDRATDVLSFGESADRGTAAAPGEAARFLGDIVISLDTARRQARRAGRDLREEIMTLAVHGALHLLGHDDTTNAANSRMLAVQDRVLAALRAGTRKGRRGILVS